MGASKQTGRRRGKLTPAAVATVPSARDIAAPLAHAPVPLEPVASAAPSLDVSAVLSAVQETAYRWDVASDRIAWGSNALQVLAVRSLATIDNNSAFQFLIAPEHAGRRQAAMMRAKVANGEGFPYRIQYRFLPDGRRSATTLRLEDHGRWWAGPDGMPTHACGVLRVISDGYRDEQRQLFRSDHDELTGQLNRLRLSEALGAILSRAERAKQPCAFLMVAIDHLAVINETFGFDVGDEVLAATARTLKGKLRSGDTIGRYSSNKFGIVLPDCGLAAMRGAAERLMRAVRDTTISTAACQLSATISIGGVQLPARQGNVQQALSRALQALDRAKLKRHDCFMICDAPAGQESARKKNGVIADQIISALHDQRMLLVLQPIMHAGSRTPAFYECLLRLELPGGGSIPAGEFMQVAERLRLSRLVDRRTLELAVDVLKKRPDVNLSLNVSGLTPGDHDWLVALHRLTGGRRHLTSRLIVEITETAMVEDLDQTVVFVDTLKELGCRVAIDDFGAGYTSFKNLKLLHVDLVKIDGAFVHNLAADPHDRVFIRTLKELADSFGLETVAEWVKDEATAAILGELGIGYLQGFLFGEPLLVGDLPPAAS